MDRRVTTTLDKATGITPPSIVKLTPMQRLILTELDHGLRPKEIAELRHLSICTVRMHIRHALSRLEANSYLAAIRKAQQAGLLESTDPILEIRQN